MISIFYNATDFFISFILLDSYNNINKDLYKDVDPFNYQFRISPSLKPSVLTVPAPSSFLSFLVLKHFFPHSNIELTDDEDETLVNPSELLGNFTELVG